MGHTRKSWALALLLSVAAAAAADEPDYVLDDVSIVAERIGEAVVETSASASSVGREEMEDRGARSVQAAIATVPGTSLSAFGPAGAQAAPSIRGSTTNQVLVLVDGVRVNDALSGFVDLATFPLDGVDRIEVLRAGASSLFGADAVGGVINIVTADGPEAPAIRLENLSYLPSPGVVGYGFRKEERSPDAASLVDSQRLGFSWSPRIGGAILSLSAGAFRAANAYPFGDLEGERRVLENAECAGASLAAGLAASLGPGSLRARLAGTVQSQGVPGPSASPTPEASEERARISAYLRYSAERFFSDLLDIEATANCDFSRTGYEDPDSGEDSLNELAAAGLDLAQKAYLSDAITLEYGAKLAYESAEGTEVGEPFRLSVGCRAGAVLGSGRISFRPTLYYDLYSDFSPGGLGAALGAVYALSDSVRLTAQISRAYRVPTFSDLHWPEGGGAAGNPDLRPESAYEADLGFEREGEGFSYSAGAYVRYAEDVILWQAGSDGTWRPSNYGAALYPGLEQEARIEIPGGFYARASHSFIYSFALSGDYDLFDDRRLPMTPIHSLAGTLGFSGEGLSASATLEYASLRYAKTANVAYLPSYFTVDAVVRKTLSGSAELYFAVDNLFGERYELVAGYPMPGASLRTGIELKLR